MQNFQTPPPKQVLLRLPDDVAAQLARAVPPRQRNKFLVDLVRRQLAQEDTQLVAACEYMNQLEAANPEFAREGQEWVESVLTKPAQAWDRDFDRAAFEREFEIAQAQLQPGNAQFK